MLARGLLYYKLENATVQMGPKFRAWGQSLFRAGMVAQGASAAEDTMQPSLRCVPISDSKYPKLLDVSRISTNLRVSLPFSQTGLLQMLL